MFIEIEWRQCDSGITMIVIPADSDYARLHGVAKLGAEVRSGLFKLLIVMRMLLLLLLLLLIIIIIIIIVMAYTAALLQTVSLSAGI